MEQFWKWLMQANARAVFGVSLLALSLSLAWGLRDEFRTREAVSLPVPGVLPRDPKGGEQEQLGVLAMVQEQLAVDPNWIPETPFRPAVTVRRQRRVEATEPAPGGEGGISESGMPGESTPASEGGGVRLPARARLIGTVEPGPTVVSLVYRGLFTRSDGSQLALMEDISRSRRSFHAVGTSLYGLQLASVATHAVLVTQADGVELELPMGQQVDFIEGVSVDE